MAVNKLFGTEEKDVLTSKNGANYLSGLEGDDKYIVNNIKKSWTMIDDARQNYADMEGFFNDVNGVFPTAYAGNDTVQINNVNANDLLLFFDVKNPNNEYADVDETLCIVHKSMFDTVMKQVMNYNLHDKFPTKGAVEIDYYFGNNPKYANNDSDSTTFGDNRIEHIQVSKDGVTKEISNIDKYINDVRTKVEDVLNGSEYSTAMEMLFDKKLSKKDKNRLMACYKTPMDLIITGTEKNNKIYAESGSDTIVFNDNSGNDTLYNANGADKLKFEDVEVSFLMKNGNNLYIYYGNEDENRVCLSNYYKSKDKLDTYTDKFGDHLISNQQIMVTGKGKIVGTEGDDIVEGSAKSDKIYGNGGNDKLYGDWGNDIIYSQSQVGSTVVLAGEEGNDKLYAGNGTDIFEFGEAYDKGEGKDVIYNADSADKLRFINIKFNDLKFTKSGNNLVITIADLNNLSDDAKAAYKNFQVTLSNYFKNESKPDEIEFIDINNPEEIKTASIFNDAKIYVSSKDKSIPEGFNKVITGSSKSDTITIGSGNGSVAPGKGNDIIHAEGSTCTINLDELDGVDTVYADSSSKITLNYIGTEEEIRFFKSSDNNHLDLIITRGLDFKKDMIIIKDYYSNQPDISYQFNDGNIQTIKSDFLDDLNAYYYPDKSKSGVIQAIGEKENIISLSKSIYFTSNEYTNDTYIVSNARNYTNITDYSGEDTLQINNITESRLKMFFNVNKENGLNVDNKALYLFDSKDATLSNLTKCLTAPNRTAYKGITIDDYLGNGKIEHIMAADANGDNSTEVDAQTKIYVVAREIQKYLQELSDKGKNYNSAAELLIYERDSKIKNKLLNLYLKTDVDKIMSEGYTFNYKHNLITSGSTLTGSDNDDIFLLNNDKNDRRNYSNLTFNGGAGNDEYQINTQRGSANTDFIYGSTVNNLNIVDTSGDDTYKVGPNIASLENSKYGISITDYEGDDTYELSTDLALGLGSATAPKRTIIDDKAGDNKLSLVGNETNVGVRFSVTLNENGGYTVGKDLIIVNSQMSFEDERFMDKNYDGCGICVKDYFENNNMSIDLNGKTLNADYLNQIAQEVAGWLSDKGYTSTNDNNIYGYNDEQLLTYFNNSNVWQDTTSGATAS